MKKKTSTADKIKYQSEILHALHHQADYSKDNEYELSKINAQMKQVVKRIVELRGLKSC